MRTFLFTLFLLIVIGGGLWYRFVGGIPVIAEEEPVFIPDEICDMLDYDLNGRAGYLLERGYEEDLNGDYEDYWICDGACAVYLIGNTAKLAFFTHPDFNNIFYLIFNSDKKNEYLKFIRQFPEITTPLPKSNDQNTSNQKICKLKAMIFANGYMRDAQGYVVAVFGDNVKDS